MRNSKVPISHLPFAVCHPLSPLSSLTSHARHLPSFVPLREHWEHPTSNGLHLGCSRWMLDVGRWMLDVFLRRLCLPLLLAFTLAGCVTKSAAKARARNAFLAGQQEAMMRMQQMQSQAQGPGVTVNGDVQTHFVPWTEGMTLAKALLAADYIGTADPAQIIIVHNGVANRIDPAMVLAGKDIPLQPGDTVQLIPQSAAQDHRPRPPSAGPWPRTGCPVTLQHCAGNFRSLPLAVRWRRALLWLCFADLRLIR